MLQVDISEIHEIFKNHATFAFDFMTQCAAEIDNSERKMYRRGS